MTRSGLLKAYQIKNSRVMENPCADPICREAFRPPTGVRFSLADMLAITNSQVMQRSIQFPFTTFILKKKRVNMQTGSYDGLTMFIAGLVERL